MPPKDPRPTFKDILRSIDTIVRRETKRSNLSPGLFLMAAVAAVIALAALVKILQQN
jgi:hypothetical protein